MNFQQTVAAAVADLDTYGYDSPERVSFWVSKLRTSAESSMVSEVTLQENLVRVFRGSYDRLVERGAILKHHPGVARFTLERVKPQLRDELDRRIMASANLIKNNREEAIEKTLRRFQGWATSIPPGENAAVNRTEAKAEVVKAMRSLPFEERRVLTDQSHKLIANLNNVMALGSGAIAGIWHHVRQQTGYSPRPDHVDRDGKVYVIRNNWAMQKGLMKLDGHKYTDEITAPAEEVYCRCSYQYLYTPGALPVNMLTALGKAELARARAALAAA